MESSVTATEFQNHAGLYLDKAAKGPVVITKHRRPARVLVDFDEYQRLQNLARARPTRTAVKAEELGEDVVTSLRTADFGHLDPELDNLLR